MTTCCFTGHRNIPFSEREQILSVLTEKIEELISTGIAVFINGGALGFDTLAAQTVLELKAEYAGGSYKTYGLSFMPTELGEVTLTASLKGTKATATTTVEVRIAPPKVMGDNDCIRSSQPR